MAEMFCLDTYALVEMALGNDKFTKYLEHPFVIPDIVLAEFYGVELRVHNEATADYWFRKLSAYTAPVQKELLVEGVKFRYRNKTKNLSFFDAVGYIYALKNGYRFLTGDKEFEGLPNVEFVKK